MADISAMHIEEIECASISQGENQREEPAIVKASSDAATDDDPPKPAKEKQEDDVGELASRISIAGIEDVVKAKTPAVKYMFIVAMIMCGIAMSYSSVLIGVSYASEDSIVVNRRAVLDPGKPPFPNITVCLPIMKVSPSQLIKSLHITEKLRKKMQKLNISATELAELAQIASSTVVYLYDKKVDNESKLIVAMKVLDATSERDTKLIYDTIKPACEISFFSCAFGGKPFDCCSNAQHYVGGKASCWHFDLNKIERTYKTDAEAVPIDSLNTVYNGLSMDVIIDERLVETDDDNVSSNGFVLHIDSLPSSFNSPEVIPFDAEAHVVLADPILMKEIDQCQEIDSIPKLNRFPYYDPIGLSCSTDRALDFALEQLGCDGIPMLSLVQLSKVPCTTEVIRFIWHMSNENADIPRGMEKEYTSRFDDVWDYVLLQNDCTVNTDSHFQHDKLKKLIADTVCKPLCERWTYPVFSASYGYLRYRPDTQIHYANTAVTRVKIYFQDSVYYEKRTETRSNLIYLAFCEIGGVWGVYLGFSIITFLQAIAYGLIICWTIRKKRKVAASVAQTPTTFVNGKKQAWV